jgi:hypothetical protein
MFVTRDLFLIAAAIRKVDEGRGKRVSLYGYSFVGWV